MKKILVAAICFCVTVGITAVAKNQTANYQVVPLPVEINMSTTPGAFRLDGRTVIAYPKGDKALESNARLLAGYIEKLTGLKLKITDKKVKNGAVILSVNPAGENAEAYRLTVTPRKVVIEGASAAGNFYGIQTLRKSIPVQDVTTTAVEFPAVEINDAPRFSYRGGHFDVARHFFPVDSVKKFIDMLALHNANKFHWHLTDDQGWRIESRRYPRLHELGSMRSGTCIGHDFDTNDNIPYGGYFTREEIRDVVDYAKARYIDVIPEVDLPGHMIAALKAYPELGCTGGPYETWTRWGVSEDLLCAGNDSTLAFIDGVLNEVMDLFPYEYIHVGGDECPKTRWEACPKCQARIAELGIATDDHSTKEQKLQTFVMTHASNTLAARGRKMIGWDEIMEGGLTPGAMVMSWRGVEGGLKAAELGHDAIMTPTNYCYFDYYQTLDRTGEPESIGGYVPLDKVYSFEPVPSTFTPAQASHIKGAQANLWTEYISSFSQAMYQELPRFAALSEVQWCAPEKKDYRAFTHRVPQMMEHYKSEGLNYARHIYDVRGTLENDPRNASVVVELEVADDAPIYYTLDGTTPTIVSKRYAAPIRLRNTCRIKAVAIRDGAASKVFTDSVTFSKATTRDITLANEPSTRYNGDGPKTLVDGKFGPDAFNTGAWLGFEAKNLDATVDLGSLMEISSVTVRNNVQTPDWIFDAKNMTVEISTDGKIFTEVASEQYPTLTTHKQEVVSHKIRFAPVRTRYVRVKEECELNIPEFHGVGAGKPGFLFVDEIVID